MQQHYCSHSSALFTSSSLFTQSCPSIFKYLLTVLLYLYTYITSTGPPSVLCPTWTKQQVNASAPFLQGYQSLYECYSLDFYRGKKTFTRTQTKRERVGLKGERFLASFSFFVVVNNKLEYLEWKSETWANVISSLHIMHPIIQDCEQTVICQFFSVDRGITAPVKFEKGKFSAVNVW